MRLLHTADLHIGNGRFGGPFRRLQDIEAMLERFTRSAEDENVDLAIVAGDLFDNRRPTPREWTVAIKWLTKLSRICPVVVTDGNHDGAAVITDHESRTLKPLASAGLGIGLGHEVLVNAGEPAVWDEWGGKFIVVTVPYPHKRLLDSNPEFKADSAMDRMEAVAAFMNEGITALHHRAVEKARLHGPWDNLCPIILVGHLTAAGATVGSERGMRMEDDITISTDVLDLFDYAALGHIHKQQRVSVKAWYAGSPLRVSFNEAMEQKGWLGVILDKGEATVQPISSGEGPMLDLMGMPEDIDYEGAYIRTRPLEAAARIDPQFFYTRGARYVEVVAIETEPRMLQAERALPADTSPQKALAHHLKVNYPDRDPEVYMARGKDIMEAT